jgi:hypothetical protein
MVSTDLVLVTRSAAYRGHSRTTARRILGRPGIQSVMLSMMAEWRRTLRSGSRPMPRHALIEPTTS